MKIDCTECTMYRTSHCDDCLVTALLHPPDVPIDLDEETSDQLSTLSGAGLIPVLRFRPRQEIPNEGDDCHNILPWPERGRTTA